MGTDIYLEWNEISKKDKQKQFTGFDISVGQTGYLRASIGMLNENEILRKIFPNKYWEVDVTGKKRYDFIKNYPLMLSCSKDYTGFELKNEKDVTNFLIFFELETNTQNEEHFKEIWFKSLILFFKLGIEKQKAKLNPTIYISW